MDQLFLFPLANNLIFCSAQILPLPEFLSLILHLLQRSYLEAVLFDDMFSSLFENFEQNFTSKFKELILACTLILVLIENHTIYCILYWVLFLAFFSCLVCIISSYIQGQCYKVSWNKAPPWQVVVGHGKLWCQGLFCNDRTRPWKQCKCRFWAKNFNFRWYISRLPCWLSSASLFLSYKRCEE